VKKEKGWVSHNAKNSGLFGPNGKLNIGGKIAGVKPDAPKARLPEGYSSN
jgi:hypothetical protein